MDRQGRVQRGELSYKGPLSTIEREKQEDSASSRNHPIKERKKTQVKQSQSVRDLSIWHLKGEESKIITEVVAIFFCASTAKEALIGKLAKNCCFETIQKNALRGRPEYPTGNVKGEEVPEHVAKCAEVAGGCIEKVKEGGGARKTEAG